MILQDDQTEEKEMAVPRASGGDPLFGFIHTRACTLFPAQAGVIHGCMYEVYEEFAVPRASGGDPKAKADAFRIADCSPRKRG